MRDEKCPEVVRVRGVNPDISIHTAGALGTRENVPQRDSFIDQLNTTLLVVAVNVEKLTHYRPESIARMRVILLFRDRASTGKTAEHEHACCVAGNGRETV